MRRRRIGSRGAAVVESALALSVLAVLVVGTIEYGYAWRQATVTEKTLQQAGRAVASMADQPLADYEALQTFRSVLDSSENVSLEYLVIYKSSTPDGQVPPGCVTASIANSCNRYVETDLALLESDFGSCSWPSPDRFWCPSTRDRDREPRPDYVGLHARLRYDGITSAIPGGLTIDQKTVYAVEPCAYGLPGC